MFDKNKCSYDYSKKYLSCLGCGEQLCFQGLIYQDINGLLHQHYKEGTSYLTQDPHTTAVFGLAIYIKYY